MTVASPLSAATSTPARHWVSPFGNGWPLAYVPAHLLRRRNLLSTSFCHGIWGRNLLGPPPVWSQARSSRRLPSGLVYRIVPPTAVVLGSIDGYSGTGIGPYWIPFSETATEQPKPVSPADAKNVRPSIAACASNAWSARWEGPNSGSVAGVSSQAPSDALA